MKTEDDPFRKHKESCDLCKNSPCPCAAGKKILLESAGWKAKKGGKL